MRHDTHTKFWSENLKGRDHLEDLYVGGRGLLKWILTKLGVKLWTVFDSGEGQVMSSCKHGNEISGSMKDRKFLDYLGNY
jgi:hypothetical protein